MFDQRLIITADLELLSPLHVGTGEVADRDDVKDKEGKSVEVSAIVRDKQGQPYIPSTSAKGVLRSLLEEDDLCKKLFGSIKREKNEKESPGAMGCLTVYGMRFEKPSSAKTVEKLPYFDADTFTYVSAHTAIDGKTGTADDHKLYHEERVAPRAIFKLRLAYTPKKDDDKLQERLWRVLSHLKREHGVAFGAGQADANGRLRLVSQFNIILEELDDAGDIGQRPFELPPAFQQSLNNLPSNSGCLPTLQLYCDVPFLVADSSYEIRTSLEKSDPRRVQVSALRGADDLPMVDGESIMGAIRARAQWLAELLDDYDEKVIVELFGSTDQRARLTLAHLAVLDAERLKTIASVALCRFSGEPIDQALFKSKCFIGTKIELLMQLDELTGKKAKKFVELLKTNLCEEGLELGHGAAKGFGWFKVEQSNDL